MNSYFIAELRRVMADGNAKIGVGRFPDLKPWPDAGSERQIPVYEVKTNYPEPQTKSTTP
ncbi:hypothetical protein C2W27_14470 [Salmonella enterica]|nr:hypothetical protein [Salmonella enterica]